MTQTLIPFRETQKRSRLHEGPYYGARLRRVLAEPEPPLTVPEAIARWYFARRWPSAVLLAFGLGVASATVALWIAL